MDFGTIGVTAATELILETYQVQEASFGVAVSNLDAAAAFQLEGRIGDYWFVLPGTLINLTPADDPASDVVSGLLVYSHCASIEAIRCRFVFAGPGTLVPTARVRGVGVKIAR
ncbi:MAG: hypothetical protein FVQ81_02105 [Candidatus Glassbacteria bacterium]|nr:hypothetical protein [Candidatus Glassbacteria bacterium]